jgi:radical SAM-linked protein
VNAAVTTSERPAALPNAAASGTGVAQRVALVYAVTGDLRYLAHQDELRMVTRALVRAAWPLAYRGGFNPRPRLTIPLPRNLGTAAERQWVVAELRSAVALADLLAGARGQMPEACPVLALHAAALRGPVRPVCVSYRVALDEVDAIGLEERVRDLLKRTSVITTRDCGPRKSTRPFDVRPHLDGLRLEGAVLRMSLRFADDRIARPTEIITELGLPAQRYLTRIERTTVQWDLTLAGPEFWPAGE